MRLRLLLSTCAIVLAPSAPWAEEKLPTVADYEAANSREKLIQDIRPTLDAALKAAPDRHVSDTCKQVDNGDVCHPGPCVPISAPANLSHPGIIKISSRIEIAGMMCQRMDICNKVYKTVCSPVMGKLKTAGPIVVQAAPSVEVIPPNKNEVPLDYLTLEETYKNCSPEKGSFSFQHVMNDSVGTVVKHSKSIKTGSAYSVGVRFSFKYADVFGTDVTGSVSGSRDVTITDGNDLDLREAKTFTFTLPVIVPAQNLLTVRHEWIKRVVPVKYKGTATVDAQLAPNAEGLSLMSSVIPDMAQRTFEFEGVVENTLMFEGRTTVLTKELKKEDCPEPTFSITSGSPQMLDGQ